MNAATQTHADGSTSPLGHTQDHSTQLAFSEISRILLGRWALLLGASLGAGIVAVGITYIMRPTFTAKATFLPPQQQQSTAASALASLGALSGLASSATGLRTPADQYVALMQSDTVANNVIDRFGFMHLYEAQYRVDARKKLASFTHISMGKKDGIISVEFDDFDPPRAAAVANQYIVELRSLTSRLALTEAQQRRVFFEGQLTKTKERLAVAQSALQSTGFTEGSLRAEPKSAAEAYARLKAETTAAEVRLQSLRGSLTDTAPEVQSQQATLASLRAHLAELSASNTADANSSDYISKYREFKYQEALFDLFSRQYESARLDESREGAIIQVIDPASPPERKSKPSRSIAGLATTAFAFVLISIYLVSASIWRRRSASGTRPQVA